jgi:hypothetical protein
MNNTVHSTMTDLLDRCSSFDNDIQFCLNDLCQRVVFIVDQLPSPVFKRRMQVQTTKEVIRIEEEPQKNKHSTQSITDNIPSVNVTTEKTEQQELSDVRPTMSTSNVIVTPTSDYICQWDNCRV